MTRCGAQRAVRAACARWSQLRLIAKIVRPSPSRSLTVPQANVEGPNFLQKAAIGLATAAAVTVTSFSPMVSALVNAHSHPLIGEGGRARGARALHRW